MKQGYFLLAVMVICTAVRGNSFTPDTLNNSGNNSSTVMLMSFDANLTASNSVNISWSTRQEYSTKYFEIERSRDGLHWQSLLSVSASGFSSTPRSYCSQDAAPLPGVNLYRLRIINVDGSYGYTPVTSLRLDVQGKISVYPNPSVSSINVSLPVAPAGSWAVSLVSLSGQVVLQQQFSKQQTTASLPVSRYPAGNYTLEITTGTGRQSTLLMIAHR